MEKQGSVVETLAIALTARVPVLLWGAPGTGKTSVIRAMADAANWPCETVIASIREPSDFAGLPIVNRSDASAADARVDFAPPRWAVRLAAAGHGLVFFDEISTAPPAVQAALLRVVLERTVGDLALPDAVSVAAAANPPSRPRTAGNSRRRSPTASATSTGRWTPARWRTASRMAGLLHPHRRSKPAGRLGWA